MLQHIWFYVDWSRRCDVWFVVVVDTNNFEEKKQTICFSNLDTKDNISQDLPGLKFYHFQATVLFSCPKIIDKLDSSLSWSQNQFKLVQNNALIEAF